MRTINTCIVTPTYNEVGNIARHLDEIFIQEAQHSEQAGVKLHVLIVDDSSPDGTAKIVRAYRKKNKRVHLLLRKEKEGLGAAYIAGIQHAIETIDPDIIMQMDADGQHDPNDIYRLIQGILDGSEYVIGSRYALGGKIPSSWSIHRRIISKCANFMTHALLDMKGVKDCSGGYKAIRSDVFRFIDWENFKVHGFAFQAALLEEVLHHGVLVSEVPISFRVRSSGESKMSLSDMLEGFSAFTRIRLKRIMHPQIRKPTRHQSV